MSEFKILKREINTEYGKEIAVIKKYNLHINQYKNRIWIFQPQDKEYLILKEKMGW